MDLHLAAPRVDRVRKYFLEILAHSALEEIIFRAPKIKSIFEFVSVFRLVFSRFTAPGPRKTPKTPKKTKNNQNTKKQKTQKTKSHVHVVVTS